MAPRYANESNDVLIVKLLLGCNRFNYRSAGVDGSCIYVYGSPYFSKLREQCQISSMAQFFKKFSPTVYYSSCSFSDPSINSGKFLMLRVILVEHLSDDTSIDHEAHIDYKPSKSSCSFMKNLR